MVSPSCASTSRPSRMNVTVFAAPFPAVIVSPRAKRLFEVFGEIFQQANKWIWRRLSEPANWSVAHGGRKLRQQIHVPRTLRHQSGRLFAAHPARRALSAALILEELHQIERHSFHIVLVGKDDNRSEERRVG